MKFRSVWIHLVTAVSLALQIPVFAAPVLCQTEIEINDVGATVEVDGRIVRGAPVVVTCDVKPREVKITSSDKQVFTRQIPGADQFDVRDRNWNVFFRPQENGAFGQIQSKTNVSNMNLAKVDKTHAQLESIRDSQIMRELKVIRTLLENFIKTHPEMHNQAQSLASNLKVQDSQIPLVAEGGVIPSRLGIGTIVKPDVVDSDKMKPILEPVSLAAKADVAETVRVPNSENSTAAALVTQEPTAQKPIGQGDSTSEKNGNSENKVLTGENRILTIVEDKPFEIKVESKIDVKKPTQQSADGRLVSSLAEGPSVGFVKGAFVQLYSLSRKKFDVEEIGKDMTAGYGSDLSGTSLRFCHWQSKKTMAEWTRVLVGPFPSLDVAKEVVKVIGRDTFSVKNPSCERETAEEFKI